MTAPISIEWRHGMSLWKIAVHYRRKISVTWALLSAEQISELLFPLAIGFSVDQLLIGSYTGLATLAGLCVAVLAFGAGRRFYDTRAYASIYRDLAMSLVRQKRKYGASTTQVTAQVNLLFEVVEYFENSLPSLFAIFIGLLGSSVMLGLLDVRLLFCCLAATLLIAIIYLLSEKRIFTYNRRQNDEFEQQVDVLESNRRRRVDLHFGRLMKWKIKLSDLETVNFSMVWIVLTGLLLGSLVLIVSNDSFSYGLKITSIMYVFEFVDMVMGFPVFYQEIIRLREIMQRLSGGESSSPEKGMKFDC